MIDITKDKKSDCFILTQTTRIEGVDYHRQLTLTREELDMLFATMYEIL